MSVGGRSRLDELRVRVHKREGQLVGVQYFREPSGADRINLATLQTALANKGVATTPGHMALPIVLCDEHGGLLFDDYTAGLKYIESLQSDALQELTDLALEATGLGALTVEAAEKKSSASPTSTSPTDSPAT